MDGDMAVGAGGIGDIAELLLMLCNPRRFIASSFQVPLSTDLLWFQF
jgi:hypothetical protein